jgi:hypothetical protein
MADDSLNSAITHGVAVVSGGGLASAVVRFFLGSVTKRLDSIEHKLDELGEKSDSRYELLIERLSKVEGKADAAHKRLDEVGSRRRR